eukprot:evm.model.NODE_3239_length_31224_cov_31.538591.5
MSCDPTHNTQHLLYRGGVPECPWENVIHKKQLNAFLAEVASKGQMECSSDDLRAEAARLACSSCRKQLEEAIDRCWMTKTTSICPSVKVTRVVCHSSSNNNTNNSSSSSSSNSSEVADEKKDKAKEKSGKQRQGRKPKANSDKKEGLEEMEKGEEGDSRDKNAIRRLGPVGGAMTMAQLEQLKALVKASTATSESLSLSCSERLVTLLEPEICVSSAGEEKSNDAGVKSKEAGFAWALLPGEGEAAKNKGNEIKSNKSKKKKKKRKTKKDEEKHGHGEDDEEGGEDDDEEETANSERAQRQQQQQQQQQRQQQQQDSELLVRRMATLGQRGSDEKEEGQGGQTPA